MRKVILTLINFLFVILVSAQTVDTILDKKVRMQTEVFVLDTKIPSQLSFVRKYDNNRILEKMPVRKLEVKTKNFTAFQIININPLRYAFSINDEFVTNFFNSEARQPATSNLAATAINEIATTSVFDYNIGAFKTESALTDIKNKIKESKRELRRASNLLENIDDEILSYEEPDSETKKKKIKSGKEDAMLNAIKKGRELNQKIDSVAAELDNELAEANTIVSKNRLDGYRILELFNTQNSKYKADYSNIQNVVDRIQKEVSELKRKKGANDNILKDFQIVMTDLQSKSSDSKKYTSAINFYNFSKKSTDEKYNEKINTLNAELYQTLNYTSSVLPTILNSTLNKDFRQPLKEEFININELVSLKNAKDLEIFLLMAYTEIGKLLEVKYADFSRKINTYSRLSYIDDEITTNIDKDKKELLALFEFVQKIIPDLNSINRTLRVDDLQFKAIGNNIRSNYIGLLQYLKKLEYTTNNNTVEYSLPTHNNLRNVDLIRYKIDRVEVGTTKTQSYTYDMWLKGGLKIDFSVGVFGSGLINSEFNTISYYKDTIGRPVALDSVYIVRKDKGGFNFAFGAMVNVYRRNGANWLNWGGSVGIVYTESQKLQFLLGPTLHFGKTERLILHGGIAMGFIDELDKSSLTILNDTDKNRLLVKGDITSVTPSTIPRFSTKWFFGISYNLSKKNALQAVSSQPGYKYYNSELNPSTTTTTPN